MGSSSRTTFSGFLKADVGVDSGGGSDDVVGSASYVAERLT